MFHAKDRNKSRECQRLLRHCLHNRRGLFRTNSLYNTHNNIDSRNGISTLPPFGSPPPLSSRVFNINTQIIIFGNLVNPSIPKMEVLDACFQKCVKENVFQQDIFKRLKIYSATHKRVTQRGAETQSGKPRKEVSVHHTKVVALPLLG